MKILYILAALMLIGIFLIFICSMKVLTDLKATNPARRVPHNPRFRQLNKPVAVKPKTQIYVIGTYIGLTLFVVGAAGSILALFQSMRRF